MIRSGDSSTLPSCPGPMGRRELLRFGLAGLGSLSLPGLFNLRAQARAATSPEPTALIVVWLQGGASHLETYDPKPLAASDYRGPYLPIHTSAAGLDICELLPHHAKVADRFNILWTVRSIATGGLETVNASRLFLALVQADLD